MRKWARLGLVAVLLVACVGCDQLSKQVVRERVPLRETHSFLGDTLRLTHAENPGIFLSVGASLPEAVRVGLFQVGVSLLVAGLLGYALFGRGLNTWDVAGFTLLAAAGLGNLIDRLVFDGNVTDFLNIGVGQVRTGIFNVADMLGVAGLLL